MLGKLIPKKRARAARDTRAKTARQEASSDYLPEHMGHRRSDCWWDPIYNPDLEGKLQRCTWDFSDNSGPSGQFIYGPTLSEKVSPGDTFKLHKVTFKNCDFQGEFDPRTLVMFDECTFIGCDFAYSHWKDAHFRKCVFEKCSISLASFDRCEFRDNTWIKIGIAGSKTDINRTFITNPDELIFASVSGTRENDKTFEHRMYQWFRLQGTRAHLARSIFKSHEQVGDDRTFYNTVKTHDLQESFSRISRSLYELFYGEWPSRVRALLAIFALALENIILRFFGVTNGWGASPTRPLIFLAAIWIVFAKIYSRFPEITDPASPYQKSFNITILAGYSNEYAVSNTPCLDFMQNLNVGFAIIFYSVFVGTVISRFSRVR